MPVRRVSLYVYEGLMATKNVLVRMLQNARIDTTDYRCNDVVVLPAKLAAAHERAGLVNADEDAVAFARDQLGSVPKEHAVSDPAPASTAPAPLPAGDDPAATAPISAQGAADGQADAQAQGAATAAGVAAAPQ